MKNRRQLLQEKYKDFSFINYSIKYFGLIPVTDNPSVRNFIKEVDKEGNELRFRYYKAVSKKVYEISGYYLKPLPYDDNGNSILYAALSLFTSKEIVDIKLEYLKEKKSKFKIKKYFFTKKLSQLDVTNYILQSIDPTKNKIEILPEGDVRPKIGCELFQTDMLRKFKEPEVEKILEQYFLYFPNSAVGLYYPRNEGAVQDCIYKTAIKWGRGLISCSNPDQTTLFSDPKVISDKEFVKILFSQTRHISKKQTRTLLYNLNNAINNGDVEYQRILENPTYRRRLLWFEKACRVTKHYGGSYSMISAMIRALKKGETFSDNRIHTAENLIHKGENIEKVLKKTTEIGHDYFLTRINSLLRYSSTKSEFLGDIKILEAINKVALRERSNYHEILSDIYQLYKFLFLYPTTEFDFKFYDIFKQIPSHGKYVKYLPQSEESKDIIEQIKIELEFVIKELIERIHEEEVGETLVITTEEIPKLERIPFVSNDELYPWIEDFKPEFSSGVISQAIYKNNGIENDTGMLYWYQVTSNLEVSKIEGDWSAVKNVKWIVGIRNKAKSEENIIRFPTSVFGDRGNNIMVGKTAVIYDLSSNTFHFMKIRNFRDFVTDHRITNIVVNLIYLVEKLKNIRFSVLDYLKLLYVVKEIPEVKDHKGHRIITHANYPKYLEIKKQNT